MSVMSIRIDVDKRKKLKAIASLEGKTMTEARMFDEEFFGNFVGLLQVDKSSKSNHF